MRTIRIYQPGPYTVGEALTLSPEAGLHVGVVLRMEVGEHLTLFSGDNQEFDAVIIAVKKQQVSVQVLSMIPCSRESSLRIHLVQGISKGQRMETVVQKAVELGVTSITPLITAHCAVKLNQEQLLKKCRQWQAIAIAACEQCGRNQLPLILEPLRFNDYVLSPKPYLQLVLDPRTSQTWRDYVPRLQTELGLFIGPEGGFSNVEMSQLKDKGVLPLQLGPRVLRTETAALVALSVLQAVRGDL